jgi:hypothetical protein
VRAELVDGAAEHVAVGRELLERGEAAARRHHRHLVFGTELAIHEPVQARPHGRELVRLDVVIVHGEDQVATAGRGLVRKGRGPGRRLRRRLHDRPEAPCEVRNGLGLAVLHHLEVGRLEVLEGLAVLARHHDIQLQELRRDPHPGDRPRGLLLGGGRARRSLDRGGENCRQYGERHRVRDSTASLSPLGGRP